jgi:murein DD-endopeptidase MepM/ murein hydrolase activator NlpD
MIVRLMIVVIAVIAGTQMAEASNCAAVQKAMKSKTILFHPTDGPVINYFGLQPNPILGVKWQHNGIDYGGTPGSPVYSAETGEVIFAGRDFGELGLVVRIRHGYGELQTIYGHLSDLNVSAGDCLFKGELIGHLGCTGICASPHLHFEVRMAVDPLQHLPQLNK